MDRLWQYSGVSQIHRVVLYARVSTRDKGQDVRNQLAQLREFCARQNWTVIHEYVDQASGKSAEKRPQFQDMMAAASRREFDLVLFWSLDRFSREGVLATLQYLQRLTSYGVGWRSFTEQYLDSCGIFRDAVLSILATIASARARPDFGARDGGFGARAEARPHWRSPADYRESATDC